MRILILLSCLMLLSSCKTKSSTTTSEVEKISIETKVTQRDTSLFVPPSHTIQTLYLGALVPDIPQRKSQTGNSKLNLSVTDGHLTAKCECDSMRIYATLLDRHTQHKQYLERQNHTVKRVRYIPRWAWILSIVGVCSALILTFQIISVIKKPFR